MKSILAMFAVLGVVTAASAHTDKTAAAGESAATEQKAEGQTGSQAGSEASQGTSEKPGMPVAAEGTAGSNASK